MSHVEVQRIKQDTQGVLQLIRETKTQKVH